MRKYHLIICVLLLTSLIAVAALQRSALIQADAQSQPTPPPYPDLKNGIGLGKRGHEASEKMGAELRQLYDQFNSGRGGASTGVAARFSDAELKEIFGIRGGANPTVSIAVTTTAGTDMSSLAASGMKVYLKLGDTVYGEIPVRSLGDLADAKTITAIQAVKSAAPPEVPKENESAFLEGDSSRGAGPVSPKPLANEFNKATLTGKGVIVGVIDTGIDWRHKDFINPDGTTRIIAIWDPFDNSNASSNGKIGTAPPVLATGGSALPGTVYTKQQINAALDGKGTVNTSDHVGHGTAVAGTAAGNGRGATQLPAATVQGVAPAAEFLIVRTFDCADFWENYIYGAAWMIQTAKKLGRPIVINQSFGGHGTVHDGTESEELALNKLTGKGIPGVIFTVSAGNEGRYSMHASSRFDRSDRIGKYSQRISVNVPSNVAGGVANLLWRFDSGDDWGIAVVPKESQFVDANGRQLIFFLFRDSTGAPKYLLGKDVVAPDWFDEFAKNVLSRVTKIGRSDRLILPLSPGTYDIYGFGASTRVVNGQFDVYLPNFRQVEFGAGTAKTGMVGSPGNAANVITVGAFNFRDSWKNSEGGDTILNIVLDDIASYSSPGGKRNFDGVVKPDITSPATYTLSPLSHDARPGRSACGDDNMGTAGTKFVMVDDNYIAWEGTSASSPFTAGVVALMLQKNPDLDAEQVRQVLIKTARKGGSVGAVPNPTWGWGMIDPAAAIAATAAASAVKKSNNMKGGN